MGIWMFRGIRPAYRAKKAGKSLLFPVSASQRIRAQRLLVLPHLFYRYLIPVYNSVQCMNGIFSFSYQPAEIIVTVIVNLCAAGVLVFGLTRAFQSEKIIYS